jgi:hypothetical protein
MGLHSARYWIRNKATGIAVGHPSAAAIIAARANDGSDAPLVEFDCPQGTEPGEWRFTLTSR